MTDSTKCAIVSSVDIVMLSTSLQGYFHRLRQKDEDTRICGRCIKKAGIFHFEIIFEGMGPFQKMPSECNHFLRSKKMYKLVPPSLSQRALGAFRKYQVVSRAHLVREKETKQEVSITI